MTTSYVNNFDIPNVCEHLSNLEMQKNPVVGENSAFFFYASLEVPLLGCTLYIVLFLLKAIATKLQNFKMLVWVHILQ